jgi:putative copper export protein
MTALALCRFIHFMSAMLAFGMSAYLWAFVPNGSGLRCRRSHAASR